LLAWRLDWGGWNNCVRWRGLAVTNGFGSYVSLVYGWLCKPINWRRRWWYESSKLILLNLKLTTRISWSTVISISSFFFFESKQISSYFLFLIWCHKVVECQSRMLFCFASSFFLTHTNGLDDLEYSWSANHEEEKAHEPRGHGVLVVSRSGGFGDIPPLFQVLLGLLVGHPHSLLSSHDGQVRD